MTRKDAPPPAETKSMPSAEWNKGLAAMWLLRRLGKGFYPVYIGDDLTDETAFMAFRTKGLTIKVGKPGKTFARYHVETLGVVRRLLDRVADLA